MEKIKKWIPSIIFNAAEVSVIFLVGRLLKLKWEIILIIFVLFVMIRISLGGALHYKSPYKCAIWSLLVFLSLYSLSNLDLIAIIMFTIFTGFISTGKADIKEMYMWKGTSSNYSDIEEYIKFNEMDDKLLEFEKKLKEKDDLLFLLYKYRFIEKYTFAEISEKTQLENPRIVEKLNQIALSIRLYCGI